MTKNSLKALERSTAIWLRLWNHPDFAKIPPEIRIGVFGEGVSVYMVRYRQLGNQEDLEIALEYSEKAVQEMTPETPLPEMFFNNFGYCLQQRFLRLGDLSSLERAKEMYEQAVWSTCPRTWDKITALSNLSGVLSHLYTHTGERYYLENAIKYLESAIEQSSAESPSLPDYLSNLGSCTHQRYQIEGNYQDLESAIAYHEKALQKIPFDKISYVTTLNSSGLVDTIPIHNEQKKEDIFNNLGTCFLDKYGQTGSSADLEHAIQLFEQALQYTPHNSIDRPSRFLNLGIGLGERYNFTNNPEDIEQATTFWRQACTLGMEYAHEVTLRSACVWGDLKFSHRDWTASAEAYSFGLQVIEQLYRAQLLRRSKESWLLEAKELPKNTAYAQARSGRFEEAIVVLEQGRARLLSEVLARDDTELNILQSQAPAIYKKYQTAVNKIRALEMQDVGGKIALPSRQTLIDVIRAARIELDEAIIAIRALPGYADFLIAPGWDDVRIAFTPKNSFVYIMATLAGGLALLVQDNEIIPVWLDDLTEDTLYERVYNYTDAYFAWQSNPRDTGIRATWFDVLDEILAWLHKVIIDPLLKTIKGDISRITLIPIDLLGQLPLHAAVSENITFTYTPNARALAATQRQSVAATHLLAIDNPNPSPLLGLRFSGEEVTAALDTFPQAQRQHLLEEAATLDAVTDALSHYSVWHFSTHGWAGWNTPLDGGLLLAGENRLTLRDLLQLEGIQARLAVLSACETGIPGTELPDEVVSLPTGLLQAGVAGVVASMWAVNDFSTALLMMRFYEAWRKKGQEPPVALHTAQQWLRTSTNAEFAAYIKQHPPYRDEVYRRFHLDLDQEKCPFTHPYYWAGFYYTGV
ncbi:MAG: CHAT domain-containing protein [Anaerolineae bacterium]|nr:CHAT domain-containing protein [Anaerolineae bacterium]